MLQFDMSAEVRDTFGKGAARSMRRSGMTPAILYGLKKDPVALKLNTKEVTRILIKAKHRNAVFTLDIDDGGKTDKKAVIIKEYQTSPVDDNLVHVDFYEIDITKPMEFEVILNFKGKPKGVELGGDLHESMKTVKLKGLVLDIPDFIEMDITRLDLGQKITCGELNIPENIELITPKDDVCVSVAYERGAAVGETDEDKEASEAV